MKAYEAKHHSSYNLRTAVRGRSDLAASDDRWTGKPRCLKSLDRVRRTSIGCRDLSRDRLPALAEKVFKAEEAD